MSNALDSLVEKYEANIKARLESEWSVGAKNRGNGHYSFAVIIKETEELVVECPDQETAEHIVGLHNKGLVGAKP